MKVMIAGTGAEFKWPDFLKPEIPVLGLLKSISKFTTENVLMIKDHGRNFTLTKMKHQGDWLFDDMKRTRYMVQHQSIDLTINMDSGTPKTERAYIVYEDAATTVELYGKIAGEVKEVKVNDMKVADVQCPLMLQGFELMGTTLKLIPDDIMNKFRANPDVWAAFVDNKDLSDMYTNPMNIGLLIVIFVIGTIFGWLLGGILGVLLGSVV